MIITNKQYAEALVALLHGAAKRDRSEILKRFLLVLRRRRDSGRLERILAAAEELFLKEKRYRKVVVESSHEPSERLEHEIKKIMGEHIFLKYKKNRGLFAGIRLWVDNTILIDASAKRSIRHLFKNKEYSRIYE